MLCPLLDCSAVTIHIFALLVVYLLMLTEDDDAST